MSTDLNDWLRQLTARFEEGLVARRLRDMSSSEHAYGEYVKNKMSGYAALQDSFQCFFYDSLVIAAEQYLQNDHTKTAPYYAMYLLCQLTSFRSIRAGEKLLYSGYPLDGLSLLRDIKDRAIFFAAQISGLTSWQALNASNLIPTRSESRDEIQKWRRACENEERRILRLMLREDSDFEEPIKQDLKIWEGFFNLEVHNSRLTMASEFGPWLTGKGSLSIEPQPNDRTIAAYINRASEVFWMIHRTLPFLQLHENAFGTDWAGKWQVLDLSFKQMEAELAKTVKLAKSIDLFITTKLPFTPATVYVERNDITKDSLVPILPAGDAK